MRLWFSGPRIAGIRPGISLGPEDWGALRGQNRSAGTVFDPDHGFIYVIKDNNGLCKIGITSNPRARLAQLQTASAVPLQLAWIGAPQKDTVAIENDAHQMLDAYRTSGEWFKVQPDAAVGAIHAVAYRRQLPVLDLDLEKAEQIRMIGSQLQFQRPQKSLFVEIRDIFWMFVLIAMVFSILLLGYLVHH